MIEIGYSPFIIGSSQAISMMVYLTIIAEIHLQKMIEFSQTKLAFFHELQKMEGYAGFTEKYGIVEYKLVIEWKNQKCLKKFQKSDPYFIFHGAMITLGVIRSIESSKVKNQNSN